MSGRSLGGCGTRTRSCGWSARSWQKQRSSSRRRATGGRRGVLVHRRGETNYPVAVVCRVLGVNRTSFHDWQRRPPSERALTDAWLTERVKQIHVASRGVYGAPRIHAELRLEHGIRVGRKRVARLMKAAAIAGIKPRKRWRTTLRVPGVEPATDLVERDFRPAAPNVLWVADITYLRSGEGWL